jgi:hypothetical protein
MLWQDRRGGDNDVYAMRVSAGGVVAPVVGVPSAGPARILLSDALPNPTRGASSLTLSLPQEATVAARIVNLAGREVLALLRGATLTAGPHALRWDGHDEAGRAAAPGIYFVEVTVGGQRLGAGSCVCPESLVAARQVESSTAWTCVYSVDERTCSRAG